MSRGRLTEEGWQAKAPAPPSLWRATNTGNSHELLSAASSRLPGRAQNLPPYSEHQHAFRAQARYPARRRIRGQRTARGGDDRRRIDRRRGQSAGLCGVAGSARQADHPLLRTLRCAAARSAGRVEIAAVRARSARRQHLRARRVRRQGAGVHPDQGGRGIAQDAPASCPST